MLVILGVGENIFGTAFASPDIGERQPCLRSAKGPRLHEASEVHWPTTEPVFRVRPKGHAAGPVPAHELKGIATGSELWEKMELQHKTPFHPPLAPFTSKVV